MVSLSAIALGLFASLMGTTNAFESDWKRVNGVLAQISYDGRSLCGVDPGGNFLCATDNLDTAPNWRGIPAPAFKWAAVWGDNVWGIAVDGMIFWGSPNPGQGWRPLPPPPGNLKQITTDGKQLCGVNLNNDIFCADNGLTSNPNWRQLPGKLKEVDLTDGVLYGVGPDDSIWYGLTDGPPEFQRIDGGLMQVAYDGEMLCGVNGANDIWCADNGIKDHPNWRNLPGKLIQVEVEAGRIFGVAPDFTIYHKWLTRPSQGGGVVAYTGWRQVDGKLRQINFDGKTACGVNDNDDIWCATSGFDGSPNWRNIPGKLMHVVVWGDYLAGVNRDQNIYWGNSNGDPQWRQLPGSLKQVSTDGKQICGSNAADEIWCADTGISTNPNWRRIPGGLNHVVVNNGVLFGVNDGDEIWVGRSTGDPRWQRIPGGLRNLEYDGIQLCGTNGINDIWCADTGFLQGAPNWHQIDGKLTYASINGGRLIGVNGNSDIFSRMDL